MKTMRLIWLFAFSVMLLGLFGCTDYFNSEKQITEKNSGSEPFEHTEYKAQTKEPEKKKPVVEKPAETAQEPPESGNPREMLQHFVLVQMTDEEGGIRNIYTDGRPYILAESMGQMMEYSLEMNNKTLFDKTWNFVKKHMMDEKYGLPYDSIWADNYEPRINKTNTDDDMRLLWALYKAEEKWGGNKGYKTSGKKIADKLVKYNQYQNILGEGFYWDENGYNNSRIMDVDDLRWEVMQTLAEEDPIWRVMVVKTNQQFLTCQNQGNGLFWQEWDIQKSRPRYAPGLNVSLTSHMLRGARYYSEYKTYVPATTLHNRMKIEWEKTGKISSGYHMEYLGKGNGVEEMETYALAGRNAVALGDCKFGEEMKKRILLDMVMDIESPIYGSVSQNRMENGIEDDMDTLLLFIEIDECETPQTTLGP